MDGQKVLTVIDIYRQKFEELSIDKIDYPHDERAIPETNQDDINEVWIHQLGHCHGMLDKMEEFVREGRLEKCFRWLGFVQGVLWSNGFFTLEDLKNHNRPAED